MVLFNNADVDQYIKLSIIKHKTAASHTWKAALNGGGGGADMLALVSGVLMRSRPSWSLSTRNIIIIIVAFFV